MTGSTGCGLANVLQFRCHETNIIGILLIFCLLTVSSEPVRAQNDPTEQNSEQLSQQNSAQNTPPTTQNLNTHNWFFFIGTGFGQIEYDTRTEERIQAQKALGGSSPSAGFFDIPALYRQILPGWGIGGVMNVGLEHVAESFQVPSSYALHLLNPSLSTIYFFGREMGLRWFARYDFGYSRFIEMRDVQDAVTGQTARYHDVAEGVFSQTGIGYGWQATPNTRVLLQGNGFVILAGERRATGLNFNVGFLF